MGSAVLALAALLSACGGSSSDSNEPAGNYQVKVTKATFPPKQFVGQTSLMRIDVTNTGKKTVPALSVTVNIEGKEGEGAQIPFAVHDPAAGLANADRPVWVLAATYPRLAGSSEPGGATTSSPRPSPSARVKKGHSVEAVWKLCAVRPGKYTVGYEIGAGLTAKPRPKPPTASPPAAPSPPKSPPPSRKPKSTPPAKSSKSKPASRQTEVRRLTALPLLVVDFETPFPVLAGQPSDPREQMARLDSEGAGEAIDQIEICFSLASQDALDRPTIDP